MTRLHGEPDMETRAMIEAEGRSPHDARLQCLVVTPESTVSDEQVDFVALPLYDGEIGIAPDHSPMIGRLGYGELRLWSRGQMKRYYVDGGFVQVADNVVSVLTPRAVPAAALDVAAAAELLAQARARKANTPELMALRDSVEQQARAQMRVAQRATSA